MRSRPPRSATEVCFLTGLAAGVTLIAERMTIRSSHRVASARAYLRLFVEPRVPGLSFHCRLSSPLRVRGVSSAARSFALAYLGLTAAFVLAWLAAPVDGGRESWQTLLVGLLGTLSVAQIAQLDSITTDTAHNPWHAVHKEEHDAVNLEVDSAACRDVASVQLPASLVHDRHCIGVAALVVVSNLVTQ
jgi:hypothetical protein